MSKAYALALIFTALFVFGCLFYLQHQVLTQRHTATFAYAEAVNFRVIELKRAQLDELVKKTNTLLQDDAKYRFRPIQPFIEYARAGEDELFSTAADFEKGDAAHLQQLLLLRRNTLNTLRDSAARLLETFGHQMDLSPDDVATKTLLQQKIIEEIVPPPSSNFAESSFTLDRDLMLLDYLNVLEQILLDVTQVSGGKMISCGGYFPVFSANIYNPKRGQVVKAKVGIGSYSTALNPDDVVLTAGSDTLTINPDGTADYEFSSSKRGIHIIDLHFQITNPLTGMVKTGTSSYTYNIR